MGQPNAERIQNIFRELVTSSVNDDRQTVDKTGCFKRGDLVRLILVDEFGCVSGVEVDDITVSGICPNDALFFDQVIDTSSAPSGYSYYIQQKTLCDVQSVLDRYCECFTQPQDYPFLVCPDITGFTLDSPVSGQGTYELVSDVLCFGAGDLVQILCDEGIAGQATVVSRDLAAGEVVLDDSIDLTGMNNCKLCNISVDLATIIGRLKDQVSDIPCDNEDLDIEDCDNTAFEASAVFLSNSSAVYWDGVRMKKGTPGTQATLSTGVGNDDIDLTSLVLGTLGNGISFEMLDPGGPSEPLTVTVTGGLIAGTKKISVSLETDGGSAIISTAEEVATAIAANADAKRLVHAQYVGTGADVVSAFSETALTGGLNDGTGDYAELERLNSNDITGTGYQWISFWIYADGSKPNRKKSPPKESEEITIDFRKPA